jgi:hypothetical protein
MRLTHLEKQAKRRELKLKGFNPQQVEEELSKIINPKIMEEEKVEEVLPVEEEASVEEEGHQEAPEPTLPGEAEPEEEEVV